MKYIQDIKIFFLYGEIIQKESFSLLYNKLTYSYFEKNIQE